MEFDGKTVLVTGTTSCIGRDTARAHLLRCRVAATSDALTLTLLGESGVARYDGSLHKWHQQPRTPLEVGR